jgi:AraC family ethanolamine operon transcriptional activator
VTLRKCISLPVPPPQSPPARRRFAGVERMQQGIAPLMPVQLTQLGAGGLRGDLLPLALGPVQLLRLRFDRPLHAGGAKPGERQLITLNLLGNRGLAPLRSHGVPLPATALFGLAGRGEIHLTTPERSDLALLSLDRGRFLQAADALGFPALDERALEGNRLTLEPRRFARLRRRLLGLLALAEREASPLASAALRERIGGELFPLLVESLAEAVAAEGTPERPPARIGLVQEAQRWIEAHASEPFSLEELCREVAAGRRSLLLGFREHLGMGPMAYRKIRCLHAVRRDLLAAEPGRIRIAEVAMAWGFLNPGHFARDYRALFGEYPHVTLSAPAPPE